MNCGVTRSDSPNQNGSTLSTPKPAFATSRIREGRSARTASRAFGITGVGRSSSLIGASRMIGNGFELLKRSVSVTVQIICDGGRRAAAPASAEIFRARRQLPDQAPHGLGGG